MFLYGTKLDLEASRYFVKRWLPNYDIFVQAVVGRPGGLLLLWDTSCDVIILCSDHWFIHFSLLCNGTKNVKYLTGV